MSPVFESESMLGSLRHNELLVEPPRQAFHSLTGRGFARFDHAPACA
jgi:hypothetical protein